MADLNISSKNKRIIVLSGASNPAGRCVLYVMSRDQRTRDNHALLAAQTEALEHGLPLAVVFVLQPNVNQRAKEHYRFLLSGLREIEVELAKKNIPLLVLIGDPKQRLMGCVTHLQPRSLYFDMNPLIGPKRLQDYIARQANCAVHAVDTHNIVPVWIASPKQEVGARTLRPKLHRLLADYLVEPPELVDHPIKWPGPIMPLAKLGQKIDKLLADLPSNGQTNLQILHPSGETAAWSRMNDFITYKLRNYAVDRNDPSKDGLSGLSPYLHFGAVSSLRVILEAKIAAASKPELQAGYETLLEEMVIRKELSDNFCWYNENYRNLSGAPTWAQNSLKSHISDQRQHLYNLKELEAAKTHDEAWNASQREMILSGKMHGYMRMYWAKKVLEWSPSPEAAIERLIYLNDFYSIDGGDPNGYVGILWSVAGLHDRPWGERPIYGNVRSMVYSGLKRKFDIEAYIAHWAI